MARLISGNPPVAKITNVNAKEMVSVRCLFEVFEKTEGAEDACICIACMGSHIRSTALSRLSHSNLSPGKPVYWLLQRLTKERIQECDRNNIGCGVLHDFAVENPRGGDRRVERGGVDEIRDIEYENRSERISASSNGADGILKGHMGNQLT